MHTIAIDNAVLPIIVRRNNRSRHMVVRYQPLTHSLTLTLPRYVSIRQGLSFVREKQAWITEQLRGRPAHVHFADGVELPVLGRTYRLRHMPGRGVVRVEGDSIIVPGAEEFLPRRVKDWLRRCAKEEMTKLALQKAAALGRRAGKISLRDTSSHWGSCNESGDLSFSWRLVLAPYEVLDYIVSHEVAHLAELNHSPAFWKIVAELCPDYPLHKSWLHEYGSRLYAYR